MSTYTNISKTSEKEVLQKLEEIGYKLETRQEHRYSLQKFDIGIGGVNFKGEDFTGFLPFVVLNNVNFNDEGIKKHIDGEGETTWDAIRNSSESAIQKMLDVALPEFLQLKPVHCYNCNGTYIKTELFANPMSSIAGANPKSAPVCQSCRCVQ